nr:uncharacterized protein LOC106691828 isoform X2 [Halyomorpha halys]
MRILITLLATMAYCLAEAPYPPSGTKPQGAVLVLPTEYGTPRANPSDKRGDQDSLTDLNAKIMQRLKEEQGSEQGVYHVYLQDGRLQKVQYTTAPITSGQQQLNEVPDILRPDFAPNRAAYFVQVPQDRIQALQAARNQQRYTQDSQGYTSAEYNQAQKDYLASVQFSPVEPITGPVYSYKPQPLTRILRYAPVFY